MSAIKTTITLVVLLLLMSTLALQILSMLTIRSMANRKGDTVLAQIRAVCATRIDMSYARCSLVYIFNFGQVEFDYTRRADAVLIELPSDSIRGNYFLLESFLIDSKVIVENFRKLKQTRKWHKHTRVCSLLLDLATSPLLQLDFSLRALFQTQPKRYQLDQLFSAFICRYAKINQTNWSQNKIIFKNPKLFSR